MKFRRSTAIVTLAIATSLAAQNAMARCATFSRKGHALVVVCGYKLGHA